MSDLLWRKVRNWAIKAGPDNPAVRALMMWRCRPAKLGFYPPVWNIQVGNRTIQIADKHFPFAHDMAQRFDHWYGQVQPKSAGVVDYSVPRLHRYPDGLEFELASLPEELNAIQGFLREYRPNSNDIIFDIGAYCGVSTYHMAKLVPDGHVYAFEPDPVSFAILERNIKRHGLQNVTAIRAGISGESGNAKFLAESTLGSRLKRTSPRDTIGEVRSIQTLSLPDACFYYQVPDFVKINIEGAEVEVLEAAVPHLRYRPRSLVVDTSHWLNGAPTTACVERLLRGYGYQVKSNDSAGFTITWAWRKV